MGSDEKEVTRVTEIYYDNPPPPHQQQYPVRPIEIKQSKKLVIKI